MWSFVVDSAKCVQLLQMLESWTQNGKERGQCSNNVWGSTKIWRYLMQTRDKLYVQLPNSELFTCLNVTKASDYEKLEVHLLQVAWQKIEKKNDSLTSKIIQPCHHKQSWKIVQPNCSRTYLDATASPNSCATLRLRTAWVVLLHKHKHRTGRVLCVPSLVRTCWAWTTELGAIHPCWMCNSRTMIQYIVWCCCRSFRDQFHMPSLRASAMRAKIRCRPSWGIKRNQKSYSFI